MPLINSGKRQGRSQQGATGSDAPTRLSEAPQRHPTRLCGVAVACESLYTCESSCSQLRSFEGWGPLERAANIEHDTKTKTENHTKERLPLAFSDAAHAASSPAHGTPYKGAL